MYSSTNARSGDNAVGCPPQDGPDTNDRHDARGTWPAASPSGASPQEAHPCAARNSPNKKSDTHHSQLERLRGEATAPPSQNIAPHARVDGAPAVLQQHQPATRRVRYSKNDVHP